MPPDDAPKAFVCDHCHWVLGEKYRSDGQRITRLRLYREARWPGAGLDLRACADHIKYGATISAGDVWCEHCGCKTPWHASKAALDEMLGQMKSRTYGLDAEVEHGREKAA